jgi:hypothetical protein
MQNSAKITLWRVNLSLKKYTFCDNWTKIEAQSWFGARIYPRAFTLGSWPLNFRIKILKYTFSLVFVKKKFIPIGPTVQKMIGDELVTDRQTTDDRQTDIFELTPIHKGNFFFFFFCLWEGKNEWGEIYTSLLATQVRFAHLLCSQGDKIQIMRKANL